MTPPRIYLKEQSTDHWIRFCSRVNTSTWKRKLTYTKRCNDYWDTSVFILSRNVCDYCRVNKIQNWYKTARFSCQILCIGRGDSFSELSDILMSFWFGEFAGRWDGESYEGWDVRKRAVVPKFSTFELSTVSNMVTYDNYLIKRKKWNRKINK